MGTKFKVTKDPFFITQPFTVAFVYPKDNEPHIIKGMYREVKSCILHHFPISFYNFSFWKYGRCRSVWGFTEEDKVYRKEGRKHVVFMGNKKLSFRRMPHRWIKEFNNERT